MAIIKLTEVSSFENNFKSQPVTNRINCIGLTNVYQNNGYTTILTVSDQKSPSLILFEGNGMFYGTSQTKEVKDIKSFKNLGIQNIDGHKDYLPELTWVDTSCGDKIYVIDAKPNLKDNTQHIIKYDKISNPSGTKTNNFTLDDVVLQKDNQRVSHFAISESRSYDAGYGGYPLTFYAINDKKEILEFDTKNYNSKIFANPQSLLWRVTNFGQKEGFVRLNENSYYWGNRGELIYAFGLEQSTGNNFFLELVNLSSLLSSSSSTYYTSAITSIPDKVKLDFGNNIDFTLSALPKFDSASHLDDKEFLIAMIPVVNGSLDTSYRDIYWFRLKSSRDEAILLADPYRIANIDRFDSSKNNESPVCIRYIKDALTLEDTIYLVTGQNDVKRFRIDLKP